MESNWAAAAKKIPNSNASLVEASWTSFAVSVASTLNRLEIEDRGVVIAKKLYPKEKSLESVSLVFKKC